MHLVSKGNVKHDGKWYEDGDKISHLKKEDGQRLIGLGIAYEAGDEDQEPETPSPLTEGDEDENLSFAELTDEDEDDEDEDEDEEEEDKPLTKAQIRAANRKKKQ